MRFKFPRRLQLGYCHFALAISLAAYSVAGFAQRAKLSPPTPICQLNRRSRKSWPNHAEIFGGIDTKKYIIETTGTGVAIFDYDNDGWPDIFW